LCARLPIACSDRAVLPVPATGCGSCWSQQPSDGGARRRGRWEQKAAAAPSQMGSLFSKGPRHLVKVLPDANNMLPDILHTRFVPPIRHVSPTNPWLPLLTPHQLVEISGAFKKFDRDGDGHIEPHELKYVMANLGCPQDNKQIEKLIAGVDVDGNGMIEFDEFVGIMAERMLRVDSNAEVEQAFALFDSNADAGGYVSVEHIRRTFMQMGSNPLPAEECDKLIAMLQPDAQGRVSMEAFKALDCWHVPLPERSKKGGPPRPPVAASSSAAG